MIHRVFRITDSLYLWLLGIGIGCIVACGMFVAPSVFRASSFLPHLTITDSGMLMAQIFLKCNMFLNFLAGIIIIYEAITFLTAKRFKHSIQRRAWSLIGWISVCMIALFTLYYTPSILDFQATLQTGTAEFDSMHRQSELVFKALLFALSGLMIWRGVLGSHPKA